MDMRAELGLAKLHYEQETHTPHVRCTLSEKALSENVVRTQGKNTHATTKEMGSIMSVREDACECVHFAHWQFSWCAALNAKHR